MKIQSWARRRFATLPFLVLSLGLLATVVAAGVARHMVDVNDRDRFAYHVTQSHDAIADRLDTYIAVLRATAGLLAAKEDSLDHASFHAFVEQLDLRAGYPGIQGIGYTVRILPGTEAAVAARMHQQGFPNFRIWPDGPRRERYSILFLEPLDRRNRAAIGYDMFSNPVRRAAMARARDTGQPAASGKVELVQEIDEEKQAGFLIYVPVYRGGQTLATLAERRSRLLGFAYSPFRADDLLRGIFGHQSNPRLAFEVYDGAPVPANLLHRSQAEVEWADSPFRMVRTLDVAGRRWTIRYVAQRGLIESSNQLMVAFVFAGGIVATLLVAGALQLQVNAYRAAQREVEERRQAEAALRESEGRLRALTDNLPSGVVYQVMTSADGTERRFTYVSQSCERLLGHSVQAALRDPAILYGAVLPADRASFAAAECEAIARRQPFDHEVRMRHADGHILWCRLVAAPRPGPKGATIWDGMLVDVTERRRAEEHQQLLVAELNHRVKNTLAIVQGIAHQSFRDAGISAEARAAFEGRIAALAAAHNLITRENWESAGLRETIREVLLPYHADSDEGPFDIHGPDLRLQPKTAISIAMALHELATNAAKYGALSTPTGRVEIGWHIEAETGRLKLCWRERGGPPVVPPKRRGFGSRMIERGLAAELGGTARLHFHREGLECEIDAPVPAV